VLEKRLLNGCLTGFFSRVTLVTTIAQDALPVAQQMSTVSTRLPLIIIREIINTFTTWETPARAWWAFFWSPQLPVANEYLRPSVMIRVLIASSRLKSFPRSINFWAYRRISFVRFRNSLKYQQNILYSTYFRTTFNSQFFTVTQIKPGLLVFS